ncbi:MAG: hypothetical protein H0U70_03505 [Tatlockia sp.]|nr:hypothetical protein [Tatlockia sp.]
MKTFFSKSYSGSCNSSEDEYNFKPLKGDHTDKKTKSLFEELEEGGNKYTCIMDTIKKGANLYAEDDDGCLPIHVAAINLMSNPQAVSLILQSFDDPNERKAYIYLKNSEDKNAFELLLDCEEIGYAIPSMLSILSYLTPTEQQALINSLSKEAKKRLEEDETAVDRQQDIEDFASLNYFIKHQSIPMCDQRRLEKVKALTNYDSDEESLGQLELVAHKKFTARVSYRDIIEQGVVIQSIPELMLIPSDWRLETGLKDHQGDHVTAYVLLLSSFSHCQGENVKKLPELVYNLAARTLPNDKKIFLEKKEKNDIELTVLRKRRIDTIACLKVYSGEEESTIQAVENTLRKAEIELIARHLEDSVDCFITKINQLDDESFSQKRKESLTGHYILQQLIQILKTVSWLQEKKYLQFRTSLIAAIQNESKNTSYQKPGGIVEKTFINIANTILAAQPNTKDIPLQLISESSNKLTQELLISFLKANTPFKKYHEGQAIKDIQSCILELRTTSRSARNNLLAAIGFQCFKLFDYPRVNDNNLNNVTVLYQALPRHFIIINAAFSDLNSLVIKEKQLIYNVFLTKVLLLQNWEGYPVSKGKIKTLLNLKILQEKILDFATLDINHNFTMKPKPLPAKPKLKEKKNLSPSP